MKKYTPEQRIAAFWKKVAIANEDDCWLWTGWRDKDGYGRLMWCDTSTGAHRIAYELTYGEFDAHLCVLHTCDYPPCVNPRHLFLGTNLDNVRDREAKGRGSIGVQRGEHNNSCKVTDEQVSEIRRRYAFGGVTQKELAAEFGIRPERISLIISRKVRS